MIPSTAIPPAAISCRFPARPTCPTACCARSTSRPSTTAGPSSRELGKAVLAGMKQVFQTSAGRHLPGVGHRRVGGGAGQHPLARGRVLMVETGHFASLWKKMAERLGLAPSSSLPGRLAPRRRSPRTIERRLAADSGARDQGGVRRAQRDVDRRDHPRCRRCARRIDAPAIRRCLLVDTISSLALDRLSPRRMGRRRHGRRLAEGADAAAGPVVQCDRRQGARRSEDGAAAALLLGLGRDARGERERATSRTRRRPTCSMGSARGDRHAARGRGLEQRVRAPRPLRPRRRGARCAPGASRSCAPTRAEYSNVLTGVIMPAGHNADALRKIVLERFDMSLGRGSARSRARCSASATSAIQRPDAVRHARRRRDGPRGWPACRIARAACRRRWTILPAHRPQRFRAQPERSSLRRRSPTRRGIARTTTTYGGVTCTTSRSAATTH